MSKTIKQIADELEITKQAVTKYIDNLGLRSSLTKSGNSFLVGESQEKAIKSAFFSNKTANQSANHTTNQSQTELATVIEVLQATISSLQEQLSIKDNQLSEKDKQISELTNALVTSQQALQQQTAALENTTAALTAAQALHAGTIQERLTDNSMAASEAEPVEEKKKGFFARLFGKN